MATTNDKSPKEYRAELAKLGKILIDHNIYPRLKIPFVPCADLLLAQVNDDPEIKTFYDQYFDHFAQRIFKPAEIKQFSCAERKGGDNTEINGAEGCMPPGCTALFGIRGSVGYIDPPPKTGITRLFIGDLVWLYWIDRMGLFEMFAKLVNDYANEGKFPINNNNMTPVTLEVMVRQLQMGLASLVRDRVGTYRRCLGWTTPAGRKMNIQTEVNSAFNSQFHLFIKTALEYYKALRLAEAIRQTTGGGASAATRVAVAEALQLLKESFRIFSYGRNNYNTLNGIVYAIATLDSIRTLRDDFGISSSYVKLSQYVSAAYARLIEGKSASEYKPNRYLLHLDCAEMGRDLLLDIEALDTDNVELVGLWLENEIVERKVETYRKAYQDITGIDLAESIQNIEQTA
jgi:hypothetical protein